MTHHTATHQEIAEMRDIGRSLSDKGLFELDTVTGTITWANEHLLQKHGFTLAQLTTMNVFDLVPEEFHEELRNMMSDMQSGKSYRFSIRPWKSATGDLIWWYSVRLKMAGHFAWFRSEYLNTTDRSGIEYTSMSSAMMTTNSYNDLYNRVQEFQLWTEEQVERLDKKDAELGDRISTLVDDVRETKKFAETAANAGLEMNQAMIHFQSKVAEEMAKQTQEILRLISTDAIHDKRLEAFENHVKKATETAMKAISQRASQEGHGLAKKVTIPVGTISVLAVIIQWVIQHWFR